MLRIAFCSCAIALLALPITAQDVSTPPSATVTLTPEQREAAIEAGAMRARDESLQNGASDRRVHGEVGVEIGSRGERAAYGTLVAPVGQNGVAAISYGTGQGPRWRGQHWRSQGSSIGMSYSNDAAPRPVPAPAEEENVNPD